MTNLYNIYRQYRSITIDSRSVAKDSIFFAIRGDVFDGNDFAAQALAKGAAYAVVDRAEVALDKRYIVVPDALIALQNLATYHRRVLGIPVLAITGSNGKTTTKELVSRVLSKRYSVSSTYGNLNNHIGVPLTLLSIGDNIEFCVVEMGASGRGEIGFLCNIAQPNFGVITNIGYAHIEGFGSIEGVKQGKGELFDFLAAHKGLAFFPKGDQTLTEMVEARANMAAEGYEIERYSDIKSSLIGSYNRYNIAAAAAIGEHFGVLRRDIEEAIGSYEPDNHRSQRVETEQNTLIMDCYNANPTSMESAIETFSTTVLAKNKAVILGDMLELGDYSDEAHIEVLEQLKRLNIDQIYLVGERFSKASKGYDDVLTFDSVEALSAYFIENSPSGCTVLIKGSHSVGLERLERVL